MPATVTHLQPVVEIVPSDVVRAVEHVEVMTTSVDCPGLLKRGIEGVALRPAGERRAFRTTAAATLVCCGGDGQLQTELSGDSFTSACTDQTALLLPAGAEVSARPSD